MYRLQIVWNREFNWANCSVVLPDNLEAAIEIAKDFRDQGDGARVKKARILDSDDKVVWTG